MVICFATADHMESLLATVWFLKQWCNFLIVYQNKNLHMDALMNVKNTHASFDIIQQHVMPIAK